MESLGTGSLDLDSLPTAHLQFPGGPAVLPYQDRFLKPFSNPSVFIWANQQTDKEFLQQNFKKQDSQ